MMEESDEIKVSLKITGFNCAPSEITKLLEIEPTKTWAKGDVIDPRIELRRKDNGWMLCSSLSGKAPLDKQSKILLETIAPKKGLFTKLPSGSEVKLFCVIYSTHGRPDISLDANIIQALANLNAGIDFDLYQLPQLKGSRKERVKS